MNQTVNIPLTFADDTSEEEKEAIIGEVKRFVARIRLSQGLRKTPDSAISFEKQMEIINVEKKAARLESTGHAPGR
ncbi:MAG: hypothetical protein RRB13_11200 [bacterium]|nr:hypothetical protein [bacterium]